MPTMVIASFMCDNPNCNYRDTIKIEPNERTKALPSGWRAELDLKTGKIVIYCAGGMCTKEKLK